MNIKSSLHLASGPLHSEGKQQEERRWSEKPLSASFHCYFYLIHSGPPTLPPFFNLFFLSYHNVSYLSRAPSCVVCPTHFVAVAPSKLKVRRGGRYFLLSPLLKNSVSSPFPFSRPPAPLHPLPLLPIWLRSTVRCVSPGRAPSSITFPLVHLQEDRHNLTRQFRICSFPACIKSLETTTSRHQCQDYMSVTFSFWRYWIRFYYSCPTKTTCECILWYQFNPLNSKTWHLVWKASCLSKNCQNHSIYQSQKLWKWKESYDFQLSDKPWTTHLSGNLIKLWWFILFKKKNAKK